MYDLGRIPEDIEKALQRHTSYIGKLLTDYEKRKKQREEQNLPVTGWVGHGRCGKDTAAAYFALETGLHYGGSLSEVMCPLIATANGQPDEVAFRERHDHRPYWYEFCNEFRCNDPTLLCKMLLGKSDMVVGIRSLPELKAAADEGVVDVFIWINRMSIPVDPTMDYDARDVLLLDRWDWIDNNRELPHLHNGVERIAKTLNMNRSDHGEG